LINPSERIAGLSVVKLPCAESQKVILGLATTESPVSNLADQGFCVLLPLSLLNEE
jgi:hypothetical protein